VKVHCDEGVATHIGPEPCADIREETGEASVGERIGQPSSREKYLSPECRRAHQHGRQHGKARYRERPTDSAWSKTLACAESLWTGTGRSRV
jgi:hypothetical protein